MRFLAMTFVLLQVCRSVKSILPVHSGCLDLDVWMRTSNNTM